LYEARRLAGLKPGAYEYKTMNRAMAIVLVPVVVVAAGYLVVLRMMGIAPGYVRLVSVVGLFAGGIYLVSRWPRKRVRSGG
jgi:uncharacterized membrane protein